MVLSFIFAYFFDINVILIIALCAVVGLIFGRGGRRRHDLFRALFGASANWTVQHRRRLRGPAAHPAGQSSSRRAGLSMGEFADVITISQMTPGPIALNAASFVGIKVAGG